MEQSGHFGKISERTPGSAEGERDRNQQSEPAQPKPEEQMDPAELADFEENVVHEDAGPELPSTPVQAPD